MALRMTLIPAPTAEGISQPIFQGRDQRRVGGEDLHEAARLRLAEATVLSHPPELTIEADVSAKVRIEAADALSEVDYGSWTRRPLSDVARLAPQAFELWRTDLMAAPHGGESLVHVRARVGRWLKSVEQQSGRIVVVCPSLIAKVVLSVALDAPLPLIWRLDLLPSSATELTHYQGRWMLRLGQ